MILGAAILAGVVLRCDGLDRRPLWYDEAATVLHLSGRTESDLRDRYDGRPVHRHELLAPAGTERAPALGTVIGAVATDEPQSGPGYFMLALGWTRIAGNDLRALRALSALASVLTLLLVYRLATRLFADADVALAAAALVALSPLHLRYAEEARPYALWSLSLLVWALAALRAREQPSPTRWIGYGIASTVTLGIHPLTVLVLPAVAALVVSPAPGRRDRRFWIANALALVAGIVWVALAWSGRATVDLTLAWTTEPIGLVALVRGGLGLLTSVFYRPAGEGGLLGVSPTSTMATLLWLVLGLTATLLAAGAVRALGRIPVVAVRRFVRRLSVWPWATLAAIDLTFGGRRSTVARYLVPSWIGLELAVAHQLSATRRQRLVLLGLLALGAGTALGTRPLAQWWDTDAPRLRALAVATAKIDAIPAVVVVTDLPPLALLELAHGLAADVTFRLGAAAPGAIAAAEWDQVVLVAPSAGLLDGARRAAGSARVLVPEGEGAMLWRVVARARG